MDEKKVRALVFGAISPLWIALHEKGLIPLREMALFYEDAVARRRFGRGESAEEASIAQEIASGIHRLANAVQASERDAEGGTGIRPPA
ncbi:MAG TPA: hypothetical protein VF389_01340 [Woeseiaceae bacterium]